MNHCIHGRNGIVIARGDVLKAGISLKFSSGE